MSPRPRACRPPETGRRAWKTATRPARVLAALFVAGMARDKARALSEVLLGGSP